MSTADADSLSANPTHSIQFYFNKVQFKIKFKYILLEKKIGRVLEAKGMCHVH